MRDKVIANLCSSNDRIEDLIRFSSELSVGKEFVLLVNKDEGLIERFQASYLNAYLRYIESDMRAKSLQMEILLFLAGTMRVDKAIERCGISNTNGFILFASSKKTWSKFRKRVNLDLIKEYKLQFDLDVAAKVAESALIEG